MDSNQIRFNDGAGYEEYMGKWSQLAGEVFLNWLAPTSNIRWLDVGCGNGAFTELIIKKSEPSSVIGIDPSEAQIAFARARLQGGNAEFHQGDAMNLPFADKSFDAAVMPLVIFFVPVPAKGVSEMKRVVCSGGSVSAYAWDMLGGGFPYEALLSEMRALGMDVPTPPQPEASRIETLRSLWSSAGLENIETREIQVERSFSSFEEYWSIVHRGPNVTSKLAAMDSENKSILKKRMIERLLADNDGKITCKAQANAIKGIIP